jgi:hypothetical protein
MPVKDSRFYPLALTAVIAGYIWVAVNIIMYEDNSASAIPGLCIFRNLTGIPCPSCGSTRSVISVIKGEFYEALLLNPIGYILTFLLIIAPLWILFDLITKKRSLYKIYQKLEKLLRIKSIAVLLIILIASVWIWNIFKGL